MYTPEISIVLPCRNETVLTALQEQTFRDFELIVPDEANTEIRGAAYNWGLETSVGRYILFLREDALPKPNFLERLLDRARETNADLVICDWTRCVPGKCDYVQPGIQAGWLKQNTKVFNLSSCLDFITQIASDHLENRLYRREFLIRKDLRFDELPACETLSFAAATLVEADTVAWLHENLIYCQEVPLKDVSALWHAVQSGIDRFHQHPRYGQIRYSAAKFIVNNLIAGLKTGIQDFGSEEAAQFYRKVHALFNEPELKELTPAQLFNTPLYRDFCSVQKHDYETMSRMFRRKLIVSVTSYPKRIGLLAQSLQTIFSQTRKADAVILWLARNQFPNAEADLPEDVQQLIAQNKLMLRWCSDLKGHKKYFWAFREFRDHLVVTIDDDLLYPQDLLECLWKSYLLYPNAVSAVRTHLMIVSEKGKILPYSDWIMETDACLHQPSMQLMATGGAGTLYPPELFRDEIFDQEAIEQTCLCADDLWIKAMELISDIPTVLARPFERLRFVPNSQEEALHNLNVGQHFNDIQMNQIICWLDHNVGKNILIEKLICTDIGQKICGIESVSRHLDTERKANRWKRLTLEQKLQSLESSLCAAKQDKERILNLEFSLQSAQQDKDRILTELSKAEQQLRVLGEEVREKRELLQEKERILDSVRKQLIQTEEALEQTDILLSRERQNFPIRRQLKNLGTAIRKQRQVDRSIRWNFKYLVYLMSWFPELLLEGMMYLLKNGAKHTMKQVCRKIFHRER